MTSRLRHAIRVFVLALIGEPVRSWRKLANGKYMCDGDCGRWSMHGVCTCGLCHFLKYEQGRYDRIERDTVSWAREGDAEQHMMDVPLREHCPHGRHLNETGLCPRCKEEVDHLIKELTGQ
jgi:hypothetical protein